MPSNVNTPKDPFPKGGNSEIPDGLDWASMEAGIFAKMEAIQAAQTKKKKRRFIGLFFIALVTITASALFLLNTSKGGPFVPDTTPKAQKLYASDSSVETIQNIEALALNSDGLKSKQIGVPLALSKPNVVGTPSDQNTEKNGIQQRNSAKQRSPVTASDVESNPTQLSLISTNTHAPIEAVDDSSILAVDFPKNLLETQLQNESTLLQEPEKSTPPSMNFMSRFGLDFGLSTWGNASNSEDWKDQTYLQSQTSYQVQGYYQKSVGRSTFILGSIQYQSLNSRLSYRKTLYDYPLVLEDTVVAIHRNLVTGQMEKLYGDVTTTTTAERIVIHHNTTTLASFTLAYGTLWEFQNIQGDIYAGLALNTITQHTGRAVYMDEIVDLRGPQNPLIQTSSKTSIIAGARLHYPLGDHFSLTSNVHVQQSLVNWSSLGMPALYPIIAGLNFGVSYAR